MDGIQCLGLAQLGTAPSVLERAPSGCLDRVVGLLLDTHRGRLITLPARALVGRSSMCAVVIDDPRASAEHAVLTWTGEHWEVRDLGSLNGTSLDGHRLATGQRAPLHRDSRLAFGGGDEWILADDRSAGPGARNETTSELVHSTSGILALPSVDDPRATVSRRTDGQWLIELGTELRTAMDGDHVDIDGVRWRLFLPSELGPVPETLKADGSPLLFGSISLWFAPSMDEEHVDVRVRADDGNESSLAPRSSHYMLLTLARARIEDARAGVALDEQGWRYATDLARMLQYSAERLNLEIFRSRALFAKLGFADSAGLIERRPASRQLRIGVARLHVTRG
jgi:FHA domain